MDTPNGTQHDSAPTVSGHADLINSFEKDGLERHLQCCRGVGNIYDDRPVAQADFALAQRLGLGIGCGATCGVCRGSGIGERG